MDGHDADVGSLSGGGDVEIVRIPHEKLVARDADSKGVVQIRCPPSDRPPCVL